jgi:RNA polymerase sigma-70 factor (ECF subfamily)
LTQGFFLVLLEKNYLRSADRERGRFRSFLLTAVKHFLCNERDRAHALKRGGGKVPISIDQNQAEAWYAPAAVDPVTPETLFDRRWALSLIERVSAKQREHYIANGKGEQFEKLSIFLNRNTDDPRYAEMAAATGLSAGALRMSVHRMRRKYRELLRAEIAETVATPKEIDDEIRFLLSTLSA